MVKPEQPRLADPVTGEISDLSPRVRALQEIWKYRESKNKEHYFPSVPVTDTSEYTVDDWNDCRDVIARNWAYQERLVRQINSQTPADELTPSDDLELFMAELLEPWRHELGFINSIAKHVDELLSK